METNFLILGVFIATYNFVAFASDPSSLQDFCVALPGGPELVHSSAANLFSFAKHPLLLNGYLCKNPTLVQPNDFSFSGLHTPGNTTNSVGSKVTPVTVSQIPGLNTLGISMVRLDFAPWGINPPHTHPRATEVLTVLSGRLEVGFVTSNRLISKTLEQGDVFVFPESLVHFQRNLGNSNAIALAGLSSQNPGVISMANSVFGSDPQIHDDILAKAFQIDDKTVDLIQSKF